MTVHNNFKLEGYSCQFLTYKHKRQRATLDPHVSEELGGASSSISTKGAAIPARYSKLDFEKSGKGRNFVYLKIVSTFKKHGKWCAIERFGR